MKIALTFLIVWIPLMAWTQYTGGQGGSYASTTLILNPKVPFEIEVSPNPVQAGAHMQVRATDVRTKVEWKLWDMDGRSMSEKTVRPEASILKWTIEAPEAAGVYLLEIAVDGRTWREKILVLER